MRFLVPVLFLFIFAVISTLPHSARAEPHGLVVDRSNGRPVPGAIITCGSVEVTSDADGRFPVRRCGEKVLARAPGYLRAEAAFGTRPLVTLTPFSPKALYLTVYGIGNRKLREKAVGLMGTRGLNALVIDVKGDAGKIPYPTSVKTAWRIGARKVTTVRDGKALVDGLKKKGIYTIARIVVFKDDPLARSRTDLAVKTRGGRLWKDREGLSWCDPFRREVWEYNLAIAEEAAMNGFDEIQFDYLRFPDANGLSFSRPNTPENRIAAITGFLKEARERLKKHNVFLAADIFGYVCWNTNDTEIGQRLEDLAPLLDYTCPMLYPSGFRFGIPGYRNPVANPNEIVSLSLKRAMKRTGLPGVRFRPWLQAFRDYAFDRRRFGSQAMSAQIEAAEGLGANGWMLWNPGNVYKKAVLEGR
jgi:hypothetical protein